VKAREVEHDFDFITRDPSVHDPHPPPEPPGRRIRSKMNAKFGPNVPPEEIIAAHTFGFFQAHERRCDAVQATFDRAWAAAERTRVFQAGKVVTHFDPGPRKKDEHILERILRQRQEERPGSRRGSIDRRRPLPKEPVGRRPMSIYFV
jgi:hypothetical protein